MNALHPAATVEFRHFHLFCGLGGGAKGFNRGKARVGSLVGKMRCIGGVDVDAASIRDFSRAAGVPGTVLDLFSREQYVAFHDREPGADWREATPADIRRAAHGERPHIVFLSAPCKGFSGLLPEKSSKTDKYQALNGLTLRGVWLMLEAWRDDPPELIIFENVPRIATRGRPVLDQIIALLRAFGYAVAETTHDCGKLGGLGQSRKRFLMVARHQEKVPPFLYQPEHKRLRGVGEVLETLPLPGDPRGGPMHRMPALQWKTWVRLAFVEAGADWRSLNKLAVEDGTLRDFAIVPDATWQGDVLGVRRWDEPSGVVAGRSTPTNGAYSVADPRAFDVHHGSYGVQEWNEPSNVVTSNGRPASGTFAVADPRAPEASQDFKGMRVVDWSGQAGAITTQRSPGSSAQSVADPRVDGHERSVMLGVRTWDQPAGVVTGKMFAGGGPNSVADPRLSVPRFNNTFRIVPWGDASPAIAGPGGPAGGLAVADPRPSGLNEKRDAFKTGGHFGVVPWSEAAGAVPAFAKNNNGPWSVADPRGGVGEDLVSLPAPEDRLVAVIRALDGTWHRPFTTLELAALQSLVDPEEMLVLDGMSDSAWRERIGNAVPPDAAEAIAGVMATTLLLAMSGETFTLSSQPIWVQPVALALAVDQRGNVPAEA